MTRRVPVLDVDAHHQIVERLDHPPLYQDYLAIRRQIDRLLPTVKFATVPHHWLAGVSTADWLALCHGIKKFLVARKQHLVASYVFVGLEVAVHQFLTDVIVSNDRL
jgi:hypothetical protein